MTFPPTLPFSFNLQADVLDLASGMRLRRSEEKRGEARRIMARNSRVVVAIGLWMGVKVTYVLQLTLSTK
jgi:hypothetical protein